MAGNSTGKEFKVTTFGESHGKFVGVIIDGCPAGLALSEADFQIELDRRIPKEPKIVSPRIEKDAAKILSGVFNGFTTGAPICAAVENKDVDSSAYDQIKDLARPGHSDYPTNIKFGGFNDYRGGGRCSGRVTVTLVLAGVIAKKILNKAKVEIYAYTKSIANVKVDKPLSVEEIRNNTFSSAVRCPDLTLAIKMEEAIVAAKNDGDSVGGTIECLALNVPVGVGEPLFDSLDADLAKILFAIPAVKGVEFGVGFIAAELKGSENNDAFAMRNGKVTALTNNAGGILGGLSDGMPLIVRVAVKPTPSIGKEQKTISLSKRKDETLTIKGRHDPCIVPKAVPIVESAVAITLVDHMIRAGFIGKVLKEKEK